MTRKTKGVQCPHNFTFFDKVAVLHLSERKDRKRHIDEQVKALRVEFFEGINDKVKGFNRSMYGLLQAYKDCDRLLVLEDDCTFLDDSNLGNCLAELPDDWDLISLGSNLRCDHFKHSSNLYRLKDAWTTHAIGYSKKMINWVLSNYDPSGATIYDEWLRINAYETKQCFMTNPIIAWQMPSYSNIWCRDADYSKALEDSKNYMK